MHSLVASGGEVFSYSFITSDEYDFFTIVSRSHKDRFLERKFLILEETIETETLLIQYLRKKAKSAHIKTLALLNS